MPGNGIQGHYSRFFEVKINIHSDILSDDMSLFASEVKYI